MLDFNTKNNICDLLKTTVCIQAMKLDSTSYCNCDSTSTYFKVASAVSSGSDEKNDEAKTISTEGTRKYYTLLTNVHTVISLQAFPVYQDNSDKFSAALNKTVRAYFQNATALQDFMTSLIKLNPTAFATSNYVSYTTSTTVSSASASTDDSNDINLSKKNWYTSNQNVIAFVVIVVVCLSVICCCGCGVYYCCCRSAKKSLNNEDPVTTEAQYVMFSTHTHLEVNSGHGEETPTAPPMYEVQVTTIASADFECAFPSTKQEIRVTASPVDA